MNPKKILIVAGEPSGDLHASNLVHDIKALNPDLKFFGMGGNLSKNAGVEISFDISKLAIVGLIEVIKNIFTISRIFKSILSQIDREKPYAAILVDYPGFNLRLAKELKKRGIPVIYYISPQIWAWGKDRINIIRNCVKKIVVFFDFEERLYRENGVDVKFVGNPLLDIVKVTSDRNETLKKYSLSPEKRTIALLPGSRKMEVSKLIPIMTEACKKITEKEPDIQFLLSKHPDLNIDLYENSVRDSGLTIRIVEKDTYNIVNASDFAVVASGTATLETAIIGTPYILVYRTNLITFAMARLVMINRSLGLANIIAGKEIVPELQQYEMTAENIASQALGILNDSTRYKLMKDELKKVKASLGSPGARLRAAQAILDSL